MNRLIVLDTTLRDGEQAPGASLNFDRKIKVAEKIALLNVDILEAGFPAASEGEFRAVREIAHSSRFSTVSALSRCVPYDIERCLDCFRDVQGSKCRIHVAIGTSSIQREYKLKMSSEELLQTISSSLSLAKSTGCEVQFGAEDATRTDPIFLDEVVDVAILSGADCICLPDTIGIAIPQVYGALFSRFREIYPQTCFAAHCHNDLGLAVANTLAAVKGGARQVECTINGIGERAGNAALEEVLMALTLHREIYSVEFDIKLEKLFEVNCTVASEMQLPIPGNKAIVGGNIFTTAAGIHQDGLLKDFRTYEAFPPETIGRTRDDFVISKHSGRSAIVEMIRRLGIVVHVDKKEALYRHVMNVADHAKVVSKSQLLEIARCYASEE